MARTRSIERMISEVQQTSASYISKDFVLEMLEKIERRQNRLGVTLLKRKVKVKRRYTFKR